MKTIIKWYLFYSLLVKCLGEYSYFDKKDIAIAKLFPNWEFCRVIAGAKLKSGFILLPEAFFSLIEDLGG